MHSRLHKLDQEHAAQQAADHVSRQKVAEEEAEDVDEEGQEGIAERRKGIFWWVTTARV